MSVFRAAGGALLLLCGWMSGLYLDRRAGTRLLRTEAMLAFLQYTRTQIDQYLLSAPELFARCDPELLEACGLETGEIPDSFEEFVGLCGKEDGEAYRLMQSFAHTFGKQYRRGQVAECDRVIKQMEKRRNALAAERPEDRRMRYTLCMTVSAVAVILLW